MIADLGSALDEQLDRLELLLSGEGAGLLSGRWPADLARSAGMNPADLLRVALGYPDATDMESVDMLRARVRQARRPRSCSTGSGQRCRGEQAPTNPP